MKLLNCREALTDNLIGRLCLLDESKSLLVLNWRFSCFIIPAPDIYMVLVWCFSGGRASNVESHGNASNDQSGGGHRFNFH